MRPVGEYVDHNSKKFEEAGISRVLVLPKKTLPGASGLDKTNKSYSELRSEFLSSTHYVTKTKGERTMPAATPVQ